MENVYKSIIENTIKGKIEKETAKSILKELRATTNNSKSDIAIIGMSVKYPGADTPNEFWDIIKNKINMVGDLSEERKNDVKDYLNFMGIDNKDVHYVKQAYINEIDKFDYKFFKITPKEANMMDPNQRMFLEITMKALEDAGYSGESIMGSNTGVFLGYSNDLREDYSKLLSDSKSDSIEIAIPGNLSSVIPGRISYFLDLKGPCMTVGTSCSSSLVSVHLACNSLSKGECETAIVGSCKLDVLPIDNEYKMGIEASDGRTKAFDDRDDGTGLGEGVAAIILKPLKSAIKDGDNIYAVIKGSAINQDGRTAGITAPNVEAQTEVIVKAWEDAKVDPKTISYIEAHGTGTKLGDPIEIEGINNAFKRYTDRKQFCAISSVKTNIGHLYEGSGIASLIKAGIALQNKQLPSTLGFEKPNSRIDFSNSSIYVNDQLKEWDSKDSPRRCGVSSFGFSGTNCHVVLEEYIGDNSISQIENNEKRIFAISAKTERSLYKIVDNFLKEFENIKKNKLEDVCYTTLVGRGHYAFRLALMVKDFDELEKLLKSVSSKKAENLNSTEVFYGFSKLIPQGRNNVQDVGITIENKRLYSEELRLRINEYNNLKEDNSNLINKMCKLYVLGADCNWNEMYKSSKMKRTSIPTYAFEKNRCWIEYDMSKSNAVLKSKIRNIDLYSKINWVNKDIEIKNCEKEKHNILVMKNSKCQDELIEGLRSYGNKVIEVEFGKEYLKINDGEFVISGNEEEYEDLLNSINFKSISKIIYSTNDFNKQITSMDILEESLNEGINSLFFLLKAISKKKINTSMDILVIGSETYKVTGKEKNMQPLDAAFFGFCKSVAKEYTNINCKCIDIDLEIGIGNLVDEIISVNDSLVVAYRDSIRYVQQIESLDLENVPNSEYRIKEKGVYVITGGLGGVGLEIAKNLANKNKINLAFINRSEFPEKESWNSILKGNSNNKISKQIIAIKEIEKNGSTVDCYKANVSSLSDMDKTFSCIREKNKEINGIFHCAGVAGNGFIRNKKYSELRNVLLAKIHGTLVIDNLTQKDKLDFLVLFSSEASILALPGQSDYTAANSFLDAFADYRSQKGRRTLAINWPSWKEVGMAKDNGIDEDTIFKQVTVKDGIDALQKLLSKDISRVVLGDWNYNKEILELVSINVSQEIEDKIKMSKLSKDTVIESIVPMKEIRIEGRPNGVYSKLEREIGNVWGNTLGFDEVNVYDSFYELGGDSIQAMKLVKVLSETLKRNIGIGEILNYTSVAELSEYIDKNYLTNKFVDMENILGIKKIEDGRDYYESSSAQKRLYVLNKLNGGDKSYNLPQGYIIKGNLDINKLEDAFNKIIERHEMLRTSFEVFNGEVVQKIHKDLKIKIHYDEISRSLINETIYGYVKEFDLSNTPLLRVFVVKVDKEENLLIVDMNHIIIDGISKNILMQEMAELYNGITLEKLTLQYKDYSNWQNKILSENKLISQGEYWKTKLSGEIPTLNIPTDYKRPMQKSSKGDVVEFKISEYQSKNIKQFASNNDSTLYMVLLAAYNVLLYKYSAQEDIIVGSPMSGRRSIKFDNVIGMFVNTILIRNYPTGLKSFNEFLKEVKENTLEALDNQDYQIDYLISELNIKRDLSRNPLFDTMFSMLNMTSANINLNELEIEEFKINEKVSKFDLTMEVEEKSNEIFIRIEYCTELFKEDTIQKMLGHYSNILKVITADNEINIDEIEIITQEEREVILEGFNNTDYKYDKDKSIGLLFEDQVKKKPKDIALKYKNKEISYTELNAKVNRFSRLLLNKGIGVGSRVGIVVGRSEDMIVSMLSILKIGAAYIPIDPTYPKERIAYILEDSKTDVVISEGELLQELNYNLIEVIDIKRENAETYNEDNIEINVNESLDAYIIYTSGSTGNPKGVRISHQCIHNFIKGVTAKINFNENKSILALTTISFDIFVLESLLPLCVGMKVILADEKEQMDPSLLAKVIVDNDINMLQMTPSRAQLLLKYCNNKNVFKNVSEIMIGGEVVPLQLVEEMKKTTNARIFNMYGPTETTVWSTISELTNKKSIDVGTPIANTKTYIVNSTNKLQPIGIPGELCIAGDGLSSGYLYRDDLTLNKFVDSPFIQGEKMYKTGDLATLRKDGTINILGRMDTQVKVRGYRIELGEIETQILKYNGIKEVVATVKINEDNESFIVAYYKSNSEFSAEILRSFLGKRLNDYMIPSFFCRIEKIPLTPNGKVDRMNLPEIALDNSNEEARIMQKSYSNNTEKEIASLWKSILNRNTIGKRDNFFDLGGTSILLIKLHSNIDEKYPGILTITDLFEYSTIEKTSNYINEKLYGEESINEKEIISKQEDGSRDIAIIGMDANMPGGLGVNGFWNELRKGTDLIDSISENRKNDSLQYINFVNKKWNNIVEYQGFLKGAFLNEIDKFDYAFFNISPREASLMDPNQRLLLQTIWKTIEDSGYGDEGFNGTKTGVYIGNSNDFGVSYRRMLEVDENSQDGIAIPGSINSVLAGRISYIMDLNGPSMVVDTACSSSLVAVDLACKAIRNGECDQAIVGGSNIILLPLETKQKIGIEASDGHAKTFDERSDGTGLGEGVIAILLKPLNKALKDKDNIYAVIKGSAVNQDGSSIGLTAPNAKAQEKVVVSACADAGVNGASIGYVEAHGTGTKLGDPIEIQGLSRALRKYTDNKQFCGIGAVKTNIGHLDSCAGLAGLMKSILILRNKEIPPTLNFESPNKKIKFEESPIYVNDKLRKWDKKDSPRRCIVNAFGLSGTNCSVVLEEAPDLTDDLEEKGMYIFTLSAKTENSLNRLIKSYIEFLNENNEISCADICFTANTGRKDYNYRLAFTIRNKEELIEKLRIIYSDKEDKKEVIYFGVTKAGLKNEDRDKELSGYNIIARDIIKTIALEDDQVEGLLELCELYVKGINIDWIELYKGEIRKKVSLPTYFFEDKRCWINIKEDESIFDLIKTELSDFRNSLGEPTMSYNKYLDIIQEYSTILLLKFFKDQGVLLDKEEKYNIEDLRINMKVSDKYKRLFSALIDIIERLGFISRTGEMIYVTEQVNNETLKTQLMDIEYVRSNILMEYPEVVDYIKLLEACVSNYKNILTGDMLATNAIFENSSVDLLQNIYKNNEYIDYYHKLTNFIMDRQVYLLKEKNTANRNIKILEIGSGTGGASQGVLKSIAKHKNIEYYYTDISLSLIEYGKENYGKDYKFTKFKRLNVEKNLTKQGFKLGDFDIVLSFDVLHATKNIDFTLKQVKKLLRKNGILVALEPTKLQDFSTLTFGTLEGWWLYEDEDLRIKNSPLLSAISWKEILKKRGFNETECIEPENGFEGLIISESNGVFEPELLNKDVSVGSSDIKIEKNQIENLMLNDTQNVLFKAWSDCLGTTEFSINDSFYELGGDSIIAMKIVNLINKSMNIELKINELLNHETICSLSEFIDNEYKKTKNVYDDLSTMNIYDKYCIEKNSEYSIYSASSAQKRMFILNELQGKSSTTYNLPRAFIVEGNLDVDNVYNAFKRIIERHESLRTKFVNVNDDIAQKIFTHLKFKVNYKYINTTNYDDIIDDFIKPFDLEKDILIRVEIIKVSEDKQLLLVDMHHIISDGISINKVINEFKKIYLKLKLENVDVQYKDYMIWQREFSKSDKCIKQEKFWLNKFKGDIPVLNLPIDYKRENIRSFEGDIFEFVLDEDIVNNLKQLTFKTQSTMYIVLLSAYNVLLSKYSGQEDIIVGTAIAGRSNSKFEDVIGMFVNTIAMRNSPKRDSTFIDFLSEVKKNSLEAYENQDYQFEELVDNLKLKRDLNHNPLFDAMFVMQNMGEFILDLQNLKISVCDSKYKSAKFDITFMAVEKEDGILFSVEYCTKLFKRETIERMSIHFTEILKSIINNPRELLKDIRILTKEEEFRINSKFNQNKIEYDKSKNVVMLFEEVVKEYPNKTAVVFGENRLTYFEVNQKANMLARTLNKMGVKTDSIVGIIMDRSDNIVIAMLAIIKAGGAYLPIDPEYPIDRISYMLQDSNSKILIIEDENTEKFDFGGSILNINNERIFDEDYTNLNLRINNNDLLYVIYTSGTTGKPKGVLIEHKGVVNYKNHFIYDLKIDNNVKVLAFASPSFDAFESEMYMTILLGGELHLTSKENLMDPKLLNNYLTENDIKVITLPPFIAETIDIDNTSLELVVTAGSESRKSLAHKIGSKIRYINAYGPTEDTVCSTMWEYNESSGYNTVPIGKPIANNRVYILDANNKLVPIGFPGELCVSSDGLARGYLNNKKLTDEKFISNPYEKNEKMYKTGDLVRWMIDGNIEYLGRIDHQVKIRGFRIELAEIESCFLNIDGIKDVIVIEKEDDNNKYLCAYYESEREFDLRILKQEIKKSLPDYMIPSHIIGLQKMPITINGKIDRAKLPDLQKKIGNIINHDEPTNEFQKKIIEICSSILKVENISVYDNLFDLGADSIRIIQIITEMRKNNLDIEIGYFFRFPTLIELSKYVTSVDNKIAVKVEKYSNDKIDGKVSIKKVEIEEICESIGRMNDEMKDSLIQGKCTREYSLSPIQYEYLDTHEKTGSVIEIFRNVNCDVIKKAVKILIETQEVLRSTLDWSEDRYFWKVHDSNKDIEIPYLDISGIEKNQINYIKDKIIASLFNKTHDKYNDIMYRLIVIKEDKDKYSVAIAINHIIYDGVSNDIIRTDLLKYCDDISNSSVVDNYEEAKYSTYITQLEKGPKEIEENEIIEKYELEDFIVGVNALQNKIQNQKSISVFKISVSKKNCISNNNSIDNSLQMSLNTVYSIVSRFMKIDTIPILMVSKGREYRGERYFNTVGNFIDTIPLILKDELNLSNIQDKLNFSIKHNINFSSLKYNKEMFSKYQKVNNLIEEILVGNNIIVNFQGPKEKIPGSLENKNIYSNMQIAQKNIVFIVRYDENEVELTMILPFIEDERKIQAILDDVEQKNSNNLFKVKSLI